MEQLEEVVKLASMPLPERPDGIVAVAKFSSVKVNNARTTEAEFERMARKNPSTIFLRCFMEYENANLLFGQADVNVIPTFDIFYGGMFVYPIDELSNDHGSRFISHPGMGFVATFAAFAWSDMSYLFFPLQRSIKILFIQATAWDASKAPIMSKWKNCWSVISFKTPTWTSFRKKV